LKKKFSFIESVKSEDDEADSISPPAKKVKTDDFFSFFPRDTPKRKRYMSGSTQCIDTYIGEECQDLLSVLTLTLALIACKPTNLPVKITNTCKIIDV
jgi:hypothetical protein